MKNTLLTQSRTTGRLRAAFSFCRHGLLVLSSLAAISAQAGQVIETVFIGGTSALSVNDFGIARSVATPLTANTVITGTVWSGPTTDKITFTLPADYKIDSASVFVSNYVAAGGTPDTGPRVLFKNGSITYGSVAFSGNGNNSVQFTSPVPAGQFDLQITAPSGLQSVGTFAESFTTNTGPPVPTVTYGSASYVITLNISPTIVTVPIAELAGSYIGLVQSDSKFKSRIAQIVSATPVKPIPNEALGARLDMTVNPNGTVTGKLVYGPTQVVFSSIFTTSTVNNVLVAQPKLVIPIPAYNRSLVLNFGTDEENEGYIEGALVQQGNESGDYDQNTGGWKNTWTTTKTPTRDVTSYKTFSLLTKSRGDAPIGNGFGTVKTGATTGTYQVAGTLADGEKINTNGFYGPKGEVLIYQYLYATRGKGSFSGSAYLQSVLQGPPKQELVDTVGPVIPQMRGIFSWIKQPSPLTQVRSGPPKKYGRPPSGSSVSSDTLYPRGFDAPTFLNGATYTPPAAGQVLNVAGKRGSSIIGVNTSISFSFESKTSEYVEAGLSITSSVAASPSNSVSVRSPMQGKSIPTQTYSGLSFQTFDVTTGYFKGSYRVALPLRPVTFEGMMVYLPGNNYYEGYGYYLLRLFEGGGSSPALGQQRGSGSVYIGTDN
ncbi:MAG: hypothetical protein NTV80_24015 [Verrucomicrobia bacterium]|nr:hypothetical protein [Verrucomicrobiota bacterium]